MVRAPFWRGADGAAGLRAVAVDSKPDILLAATDGWQAPDLPLYPAFRDR